MKTSLLFSEADHGLLLSILDPETIGPKPASDQKAAFDEMLKKAKVTRDESQLNEYVGFNDRVSLVSPSDPGDSFDLQIVPPAEANPDQDRISVFLPVAFAVLGRRCGESVSWEGPRGPREMKITSVEKFEQAAV